MNDSSTSDIFVFSDLRLQLLVVDTVSYAFDCIIFFYAFLVPNFPVVQWLIQHMAGKLRSLQISKKRQRKLKERRTSWVQGKLRYPSVSVLNC